MGKKNNSDFKLLVQAASFLKSDFENLNDKWNNSPLKWVKHLSSGSKGKLGERLIA